MARNVHISLVNTHQQGENYESGFSRQCNCSLMQLLHSGFGTVVAGSLDIGRLHVRDVGHFVGNIAGLDYPSLVYHRRGSLQPFTALSIVPWQAWIRLVSNSFSTGAGSVYTG